MKKYTCNGYRSIPVNTVDSMREAAEIFGNRAARREFGNRGHVGAICQTAHSQDGRLGEYSAFIGCSSGQNQMSGHNINFSVFVSE